MTEPVSVSLENERIAAYNDVGMAITLWWISWIGCAPRSRPFINAINPRLCSQPRCLHEEFLLHRALFPGRHATNPSGQEAAVGKLRGLYSVASFPKIEVSRLAFKRSMMTRSPSDKSVIWQLCGTESFAPATGLAGAIGEFQNTALNRRSFRRPHLGI